MGKLDGKVALISGGARGQGAAEARRFTEEGARVVFGDVRDADVAIRPRPIEPDHAIPACEQRAAEVDEARRPAARAVDEQDPSTALAPGPGRDPARPQCHVESLSIPKPTRHALADGAARWRAEETLSPAGREIG